MEMVLKALRGLACNLIILSSLVLSMEPQAGMLTQVRETSAATAGSYAKTDRTSKASTSQDSPSSDRSKASDRKVVYQGIAVELNVKPVASREKETGEIREGDDVTFQFMISYPATNAPLTGARPAAWMDLQRPGDKDCATKVKAFITGGLVARPQLD